MKELSLRSSRIAALVCLVAVLSLPLVASTHQDNQDAPSVVELSPVSTNFLVSIRAAGGTGNNTSSQQHVSTSGNCVVFESSSTDLIAGQTDTNGQTDVFWRNFETGTTKLLTHTSATTTTTGNDDSRTGTITPDGRWVAFQSRATDLTTAAHNNSVSNEDVYLADTNATPPTIRLVSVNNTNTGTGNSDSDTPRVTADGRYVFFSSLSTDIATAGVDTNAFYDIYRADMSTDPPTMRLVTHNAANQGSNGNSRALQISPDGRFVVFSSTAADLVAAGVDNNAMQDIYMADMSVNPPAISLVSINTAGTHSGDNFSYGGSPTPDGRWVVFTSYSSNLTTQTDNNGASGDSRDVYVRDMQTGTTRLVSINTAGTGTGSLDSQSGYTDVDLQPPISNDGRYVVFLSSATTDLVSGITDANGQDDVLVRDMVANTTSVVNLTPAGTATANGIVGSYSISADGRSVVFNSTGTNIVTGFMDGNVSTNGDLYLRDRVAGTTALLSFVGSSTQSANGYAGNHVATRDGRYVIFESTSTNQTADASNNNGIFPPQPSAPDLFVQDLGGANAPRVSNVNSNADTGDGTVSENETTAAAITQLVVAFDSPMNASIAGNAANYLLVGDGPNNSFQTTSCQGGVQGDDAAIAINSVSYNAGAMQATLSINSGIALPAERYRLFACGTLERQLVSGARVPMRLDGNADGVGGDDFTRTFTVSNAAPDLAVAISDSPDPITTGGTLTYTITVANSGSAAAANVTVTDNLPPQLTFATCSSTLGGTCGGSGNNRTVTFTSLANGQTATITFTATVNCSVANGTSISNTVSATTTTGEPNVGNNSATATTTANNPAPSITCPANVTQNAAAGGCTATVTYTTPTATDNCPSPTVNCVPGSGSAFPVGTNTVTCTATDSGGRVAGCSFLVTVVDNQPPTLTCPAPVSVSAGASCNAVVNFATPTATDNCAGATVTCVPASGSTFPLGVTTVTCTATDAGGNTAPCTFTVTVSDTTPPTITCPANITANSAGGQCSAAVTFATPTASDNCSGVGTVTCSPASGSTFPLGITTVTCSVMDAAGNPGSCAFTVTVSDLENPTITCPANITTNAAAGQCGAVATFSPTASDNCPGVTVVCVPASGSTFPIGVTTVTCTATDASAHTATCSFTVTVVDSQAPQIVCPANVTVVENPPSSGTATVNYTTPTASDNCPGATVACVPASGSAFPVGTTTVTCTATDASANSSQCGFTVTVQPACTIACPANISTTTDPGLCGAAVKFAPSTTGNCGTVTCTPAAGSFFPVGTTTVSCTTTVGPSCSFTVTVADAQAPALSCPASVTANADTGVCIAVVNYAVGVSDNCPGATVTCVPASGSAFAVGTTTVTCTATDAANNTSSCSFGVMVVDNQAPQIVCPADITTTGALSGCLATAVVNYPAPTVVDNCPGTTVTCVPASGSTFTEGVTTVTCTATDASGNSSTCAFTVTVGTPFTFCAVDDATGDLFQMDTNAASPTYRNWRYRIVATNVTICGTASSLTYYPGVRLIAYDNDYSQENPTYNMSATFGATSGTVTIKRPGGQTVAFLRDRNLANSTCQ